MGELWASDGILEMVEPGALVTFYFALLLVLRIPVRIMSTLKRRMDSSVPTAADRDRLKRRMNSPVFRSDSSSEPCKGSDCDLMAPLLLSCGYAAPHWWVLPRRYIPGEIAVYEAFFDSGLRGVIPALIVGLCNLFEISPSQLNPPAWRILIAIQNVGDLEYLPLAGTHPAPAEEERAVIWARQLPVDRRQVNFLVRDMAGGVANDPFTAYQEAAKVMSAKKGSSSRSASGDEQSADVARSAGSVAVTLSNLNLNVFPQDGTVLSIGDPSEVVQVLQGGLLRTVSQLYHLGERLSSEGLPTLREEIEDLKRQVSGERDQRAARELEIRDLKDKVKDLEKVAEASSADALATSQKNQ
ncbi:hypothetical protein F2Q70_00038184 [Brassica cretica]|uniref:Uncharacterized protein n=1 Tax=Brassica cretica TaxID=69181 RepID=A0A8S9K5J4_BRACR|nr:hypothetical protein F2Q70_00038184 [Brassica cretica]